MIIPHAKPGSSAVNKTGKWKSMQPFVDAKKCIKCGICQDICPEGIMGEKKKIPEIDLNYCKGCASCSENCPVKAIEMKRVEENGN